MSTPQDATETPNPKPKKPSSSSSNKPNSNLNKKTPTPDGETTPYSTDIIASNYVILNQIGKGAFGEIFLSFNLRDNIEVAIKKEQKRLNKTPQLKTESKIYQTLLNIDPSQDTTGTISLQQEEVQGIPKFYGMGECQNGTGYYLIMEFLGPNLIELFKFCNMKKFTITTVCLITMQILNRIEYLHKHNFIHRDIKPENFMIGSQNNANIIYLIDYGLSKRYKNAKNNQHIPYREGRNLIGTARYVSINTHLGIEQSRRDDLESIGYLIVFFLKGYLPWQGLKGGDKYQKIMEKKLQIPTDILCLNLPEEISIYLNYVKGLRFEDRPDYEFLKGLFVKVLSRCISTYNLGKEYLKFDWSFEDPKNTIWKMLKDKKTVKKDKKKDNKEEEDKINDEKNMANVVNAVNEFVNNESKKNTFGENKNMSVIQKIEEEKMAKAKANENVTFKEKENESKGKDEVKQNNDEILFDKTNENNPDASLGNSSDKSSSSIKKKDSNNIEVNNKESQSKDSKENKENKENENKEIDNEKISEEEDDKTEKDDSEEVQKAIINENNNIKKEEQTNKNINNNDNDNNEVLNKTGNAKPEEEDEEKSEDTISQEFRPDLCKISEIPIQIYEGIKCKDKENSLDNHIDMYIQKLMSEVNKAKTQNKNKNQNEKEKEKEKEKETEGNTNNTPENDNNKYESTRQAQEVPTQNSKATPNNPQVSTSNKNVNQNKSPSQSQGPSPNASSNNNINNNENDDDESEKKSSSSESDTEKEPESPKNNAYSNMPSNAKSTSNMNNKNIIVSSNLALSPKKDQSHRNNEADIKKKTSKNYNIEFAKNNESNMGSVNAQPASMAKKKEISNFYESNIGKEKENSNYEPPMIVVTPDYKADPIKEESSINDKFTSKFMDSNVYEKIKNEDSTLGVKKDESNFKKEKDKEKEKEKIQSEIEGLNAKSDEPISFEKQLQNNTSNQIIMKISKETIIKIKREPLSKHYIIQTDIGQGSYGKVKRVRHKKLGEERAMKIVIKSNESSHNEVEILRRVSHPNIMNIYEIFEDSKKYYIITELLDGGELFDFITSQGSFSETDAAVLMKQILQGVNYLHSNYIIHRDLKPENIMLVSKPNSFKKYSLKIIDFGTAVQIRPGQKITKFIGTSYYIAPEVLEERYDEKCDIWSCGVILYILLCGYPPFNGSSNIDIFHNIQYSQPMFSADEWREVTPSAIDLIKSMLNKNPKQRLTAEQCLNHKWFKDNENDDPFGLKVFKKSNQLKAVDKMSEFVKENKFKQAVLQFITNTFDIKQEEEQLREIFKQFDVEGTGQITKKVFYKELSKLYGEQEAREKTNKIFNTLDLDGNGDISYNEFLTSIIDSKKFITNDRLDKAFKLFDKDGNGKLSIDEIRAVFGGDEKKWRAIIREVDLNDDGEVDFEEFKLLMTGAKTQNLIEASANSINKKEGVVK